MKSLGQNKTVEVSKTVVALVSTGGEKIIIDRASLALIGSRCVAIVERHKKYGRLCYNGKHIKLHRLIMDAKPGEIIDHINNDGLDNRTANLRRCTSFENMHNRTKKKNNTTGYKGVYAHRGCFCASIAHHGVKYHIGRYLTAKEAAIAYNKKAKELHGEFSRINAL